MVSTIPMHQSCRVVQEFLLACRAGVTPFLAAHLHGYDNFKWMLYGDDDTVFFIDNALDMLEGLDHNMPYFLTDNIWFPDQFGKQCNAASQHCAAVHAQVTQGNLGYTAYTLLPISIIINN